jgi:hypothetical protein
MPNSQRHRGAHPDDARLFSPEQCNKLRTAVEEAAWLLGRGYAPNSVVDVVGRRHELEARQRLALTRAMCSRAQVASRGAHLLSSEALAGQKLLIDGFNLLITLEVAASGGVLLACPDGTLRDIAGMRGSYHPVEETDTALTVLARTLSRLSLAGVQFYLDAPVSNSGRLRERIMTHAPEFGAPVEVELVRDPDQTLAGLRNVVSADSVVIDAAETWVNLAAPITKEYFENAWLVELTLPELA